MVVKTEGFLINDVEWEYSENRENTGDINRAPERFKKRIRSANIVCQACSNRWHATTGERPGQLRQIIGAVEITCPKCGAHESVQASLL